MRTAEEGAASLGEGTRRRSCARSFTLTTPVMCCALALLWGVMSPMPCVGQTLADAVDSPVYSWVGDGDVPWTGGTAVTHDGLDAACSGVLAKGQKSALRTTVIGPGSVTFWWKVSSTIYDYLEFDRSGNYQAEISGETGWEQRAFAIFAGTNVLEWIYEKSSQTVEGANRAWVDQVVVITNSTTPPAVVRQPFSRTVAAGATVAFQVEASGSYPLKYQWRLNGSDLSGATSRYLSLANVQASQSGNYSVVVTNAAGTTISSNAALVVLSSLEGGVDTTGLTWKTTSPEWFVQTTNTHDGADALQSGPVAGGGHSTVWTTVAGPGTVAFWWKASSRMNTDPLYPEDGLVFSTSGVMECISDETGWERRAFPIASGVQTLNWQYIQSQDPGEGLDAGWLDQVVIVTNSGVAPTIVRQPQPIEVVSGEAGTLKVEVLGSMPITYQWRFNGAAIAGGTNRSLTISNASLATAGPYSVSVTNATGWAVSSNVNLVIRPNIAEAADATNVVWDTGSPWGPSWGWFGQTSVGWNNEDAAQSRPLPEGCVYSLLLASFQGPAQLSFWWRNTSAHYDLIFDLEETETTVPYLTCPTDGYWHHVTVAYTNGPHTVQWRYVGGSTNETGAAWVDQVLVIESKGPPVIVTQPISQRAIPGTDLECSVQASGLLPLSYQWYFNGKPLAGETDSVLPLAAITQSQTGAYSVSVSNTLGVAVSSNAVITVAQPSGEPFKLGLVSTNLQTREHGLWYITPGGFVTSGSRLFYSTEEAVLSYDLEDLSQRTTVEQKFYGMVSDLRSGKIYCMANGYGLVGRISSQALPVTSLIEVDGETGQVLTNRVQLSREIWLEAPSVFSGYGRCVILQSVGRSGSSDIQRVYDIALPSGQVLDLGETWTFIGELNDMWGVAEFSGQQLSLVYGARAGLRRLDLPGSFGSHLVSFPNIYAVEHVAVSIPLNRLYVEAIRGADGGRRVVGSCDFLFAPCITGPLETSGAASLDFEVRSPIEHNVTIEASTNLTTWTTFTNMANPSGTVRFKVPKSGLPKNFYRAKTQ